MASDEFRWLKRHYEEGSTGGPTAKRVKFQTLHEQMSSQFPSKRFNSQMVSAYIKEAFPMSVSKRCGQSKATHIFGIQLRSNPGASTPALPISSDSSLSSDISTIEENRLLKERVKQLEERIHELEKHAPERFSQQMNHLTFPSNAIYHGPDTLQHFTDFSMDVLIDECKQYAPDLFKLLTNLGEADRLALEPGETPYLATAKVITALSTLSKCKSKKVLGIQLLISFMLIARSASRQVCHPCMYGEQVMFAFLIHCTHYTDNRNTESCWGMCIILYGMEILARIDTTVKIPRGSAKWTLAMGLRQP